MEQQIILVTGATAGIGRDVALTLARRGHRVFATGRRAAALASLAEEAKGLALETLVLDVTSGPSIEAARREIEERTGGHGVDVLVNNAGYGAMGPVEEVSLEALRAQYETNVFGLVEVTKAFVPAMRERRQGKVINVSSMGGRVTFPMMGVYNSTKYAVESLSDALRVELRPFGVSVVLIEPGAVKTEFADVAFATIPEANGSPYAGAMRNADDLRKKFEATYVGPEVVSRAIARAVETKRPRARYVTPWTASLMVAFLRLLPTSWADAALGVATGLTRKNLLPPAPSAVAT